MLVSPRQRVAQHAREAAGVPRRDGVRLQLATEHPEHLQVEVARAVEAKAVRPLEPLGPLRLRVPLGRAAPLAAEVEGGQLLEVMAPCRCRQGPAACPPPAQQPRESPSRARRSVRGVTV